MAVRPGPESRVVRKRRGRPFRLDFQPAAANFSYSPFTKETPENRTNSVGFARAMAKSWQRW